MLQGPDGLVDEPGTRKGRGRPAKLVLLVPRTTSTRPFAGARRPLKSSWPSRVPQLVVDEVVSAMAVVWPVALQPVPKGWWTRGGFVLAPDALSKEPPAVAARDGMITSQHRPAVPPWLKGVSRGMFKSKL